MGTRYAIHFVDWNKSSTFAVKNHNFTLLHIYIWNGTSRPKNGNRYTGTLL
jgi:hypothetical protein